MYMLRSVPGPLWLFVVLLLIASTRVGAQSTFKYEGAWEGQVSIGFKSHLAPEWSWMENKAGFRLVFSPRTRTAGVFTGSPGNWRPVKPNQFRLTVNDTNALVVSMDSGRDADGTWVETWIFTLTPIDATRMHVMWLRQVKNKGLDPSHKDAVFGGFSYGELTKVVDLGD